MTANFILMILSASALPLLAFLALILRRNISTGYWKLFFLTIGLGLLVFTVINTFKEHGEELNYSDAFIGIITATITIFILSKFNHGHKHSVESEGAKGIVISEAFHSLIDGAVIGATYLVNPLIGYAATIGIITHELPKIIGTITVLRGFGLSVKRTIMYGMFAQIGSPVTAIFVYMLGKQIDQEKFHALEIASISSLAAIVLWIIYLEIRFHVKHPEDSNHKH